MARSQRLFISALGVPGGDGFAVVALQGAGGVAHVGVEIANDLAGAPGEQAAEKAEEGEIEEGVVPDAGTRLRLGKQGGGGLVPFALEP